MAVAMAAFTVVPAHAADTYVAIYYSPADFNYGVANNAPTRADAERAANDQCVQHGGTACRLAAWAKNGCAALAWDAYGGWKGGSGATIAEAEQAALAGVKRPGSIFQSECST